MSNKRKGNGMPKSVVQGTRILGRASGNSALLFGTSKAENGSIVIPEGPLEQTVLHLADLDPRVLSVRCQPFTIDIVTGKIYEDRQDLLNDRALRHKPEIKIREYTPDVLFSLDYGKKLVAEVKDPRFMGDEQYKNKVDRAAEILLANGYPFSYITMLYEESNPLVQNAKLLTQFAKTYVGFITDFQRVQLAEFLKTDSRTLGEVCNHLNISLREAPILILSGLVSIDLKSSRISAKSPVQLANGDLQHLMLLPFDGSYS